MSDLHFELVERLTPVVQQGDVAACEAVVETELRKLPVTPFHIALELQITNDPNSAASYFDRFLAREARRFQIGAMYAEMNGFAINPDNWHCDVFAYEVDGGHEDYDWLADWQSDDVDWYELTGLERLQKVYRTLFGEKAFRDAEGACDLLVAIKFQKFIQQAASRMKRLRFPFYATAHGFDFIASFDPH